MNARRPLFPLLLSSLSLLASLTASGQCTNASQYPGATIAPDPGGAVTNISGCNFTTEYSQVGPIVGGATYEFTISNGLYITVRQGTPDGAVVAQGYTPLVVTAFTNDNLFVHWNLDEFCAGNTSCQTTTVQLFLNCTPPSYSVTTVNDCDNSQFFVNVDITSLGDAGSLTVSYTVDNGPATSLPGTGTGVLQLGPFPNLSIIDVVLEHDTDPACNRAALDVTNFPCPIISCGIDNYTHCYGNTEEYIRVFQGNSTFPLRLQFNSGDIYQFGGDVLTIHDGLSDAAPVLYTGVGNNGDLTGVNVTSTNGDFALTLKLVSDGFTSCGDGGLQDQWDYSIGCLDCTPPTGSAGLVTTDCANQFFTVQVEVTSLGTDPQIEIGNDVGVAPTPVSTPGSYTAGPFPVGNPVELTLVNDANALCNLTLGSFENSFCPIQIVCGAPAFEDSYCYGSGELITDTYWVYENTGANPLALLFSQGTIESHNYEDLRIYSGTDNTGDLLYEHLTFNTVQLDGVLAISNPGESIYMEMSSDGSVSCADGSFGYVEWQWTVGCLDCLQPTVEFDVVLDCANEQFFINSTISDLGTDPEFTITNTGGAPTIPVSAVGTYTSGPFDFGASVQVELLTDANTLCSRRSGYRTNAPCPLVSCGPNQYEFCYPNAMDTSIVYQSANEYPIAVIFNAGQIALFGDSIYVYDGPDYYAPLIYSGFNNGDLAGLLFTSTNPDNALCFRFVSNDFFESCTDQFGWTPWNWSVSCLDCTNPDLTFERVPDCVHNGYNIVVNVTNVGVNAPENLMISNSYDTDTLFNIGLGTTVVGPFPVDEITHLTVMNQANPLCRRVSPDYTYPADSCVYVACEATGSEYCYQNADTAYFTYTSGNNDPITIQFEYGQLLVNDYIQIYNGLNTSAQLVYMGNNGGQMGGFAISSSNPDNAITLLVISSQVGACASGQATPLYWSVGCGLVGVNEFTVDGFAMFPNPSNGEVFIRMDDAVTGNVRMDVMDVTGRVLLQQQFNAAAGITRSFDLGDLVNGNYLVRLSTGNWAKSSVLQIAR